MKKFLPFFLVLLIMILLATGGILLYKARHKTSGNTDNIPDISSYCVDYMGSPDPEGTCSAVNIDARKCSSDDECTATCAFGCVSKDWNNSQIDCEAEPLYSCKCLDNYCQLKEKLSSDTSKCGLENCHGLDIECGPNIAETCTEMYQLGDKCREFARCKIIDGVCQQEQSDLFDSCKSCVEKCINDLPDDIEGSFQCEIEC